VLNAKKQYIDENCSYTNSAEDNVTYNCLGKPDYDIVAKSQNINRDYDKYLFKQDDVFTLSCYRSDKSCLRWSAQSNKYNLSAKKQKSIDSINDRMQNRGNIKCEVENIKVLGTNKTFNWTWKVENPEITKLGTLDNKGQIIGKTLKEIVKYINEWQPEIRNAGNHNEYYTDSPKDVYYYLSCGVEYLRDLVK
jgi:hypothetical protein